MSRVGSSEEAAVGETQTAIEFRLLGSFEALRAGVPVKVGGLKQRALLAVLLLHANEVVSRDRLIEHLWGEDPPEDAAHTVQVFVSRLRKAIGQDILETRAPGYLVRIAAERLDVTRFQRLRVLGREALEQKRAPAAEQVLGEALSLFRGPPLADFEYEPWAQQEVARLEEARLACLEEQVEARLELGHAGELVGELERLVSEHPLRERLRRQLMIALYRHGRQAEALDCYQQINALLRDELGIEPSPELRELQRRILNQDATLALEPPPAPARVNLPTPLTPFVVRERELVDIKAILDRPDVRLLTLTGPGGTGKTRLAVQAAREVAGRFRDGVFWVPLANVRQHDLVLATIYSILDVDGELDEKLHRRGAAARGGQLRADPGRRS